MKITLLIQLVVGAFALSGCGNIDRTKVHTPHDSAVDLETIASTFNVAGLNSRNFISPEGHRTGQAVRREDRVTPSPLPTPAVQSTSSNFAPFFISSREILIPGIEQPYNPSIANYKDHYLMAFRYDVGSNQLNRSAYMGLVELDKNFQVIGKVHPLDSGSNNSHDPRLVRGGDKWWIYYNDFGVSSEASQHEQRALVRIMHRSRLLFQKGSWFLDDIMDFDLGDGRVEKNWPPFFYSSQKTPGKMLMIYDIGNSHVLEENKDRDSGCEVFSFLGDNSSIQWKKRWGEIRGGTPAILVEGEYLGFFHSSFNRKGHIYYVMGAYTFESQAPFRITRISPYPILFKGMFDTPLRGFADPNMRVVFPAGIALTQQDGKPVIIVSYGENDTAAKVALFDKDVLYESLQKL